MEFAITRAGRVKWYGKHPRRTLFARFVTRAQADWTSRAGPSRRQARLRIVWEGAR